MREGRAWRPPAFPPGSGQEHALGRVHSRTNIREVCSFRSGVRLGQLGAGGGGSSRPNAAFLKWENLMMQEFPPHSLNQPGPICHGHHAVIMALSAVPWSCPATALIPSRPRFRSRMRTTRVFKETDTTSGS